MLLVSVEDPLNVGSIEREVEEWNRDNIYGIYGISAFGPLSRSLKMIQLPMCQSICMYVLYSTDTEYMIECTQVKTTEACIPL